MDVRKILRGVSRSPRSSDAAPSGLGEDYAARAAAEQQFFADRGPSSDLPAIYHYWSNKHLRPRLARAGFDGPIDMFQRKFAEAYNGSPSNVRRFLSIGAGDCQTEIALAEHLVRQEKGDFVFECFEFNPTLVARATRQAIERGMSDRLSIVQVDANLWSPQHEYDGVLANSSLHHIQNLEGLFDGVSRSLRPSGSFVTSDTIGRNGHMRWPEALSLVEQYWEELPDSYRFNRQLQRLERKFVNLDCSSDAFEGIRAQDILPLLIRYFDFDYFAAFANVVDPFIERSFGPNFDPGREWDAAFIDRIDARDWKEIHAGRIKPTHLIAAMCVDRPGRNVMVDGLTPNFCVRYPGHAPRGNLRHATSELTPPEAKLGVGDKQESESSSTNFSDLWWNPNEPGWGVSIHHHPGGQLVAIWLGYDVEGAPTWFQMLPGEGVTGPTFTGPVYRYSHSPCPDSGDCGALMSESVGSGTLVFEGSNRGTLTLNLQDEMIFKLIERMQF